MRDLALLWRKPEDMKPAPIRRCIADGCRTLTGSPTRFCSMHRKPSALSTAELLRRRQEDREARDELFDTEAREEA